MGSKKRIAQKLKQNDEYPALCRFLRAAGLAFSTHCATGSAHPYLLIDLPCGRQLKHNIACTPSGGGHPARALSHLKRCLRAEGYDLGK